MAWVESITITDRRDVTLRDGYAKAERAFTISFAPGELPTTDDAKVKMYFREMGSLCYGAILEALPQAPGPQPTRMADVVPPAVPSAPPEPPKASSTAPSPASAPVAPATDPPAFKTAAEDLWRDNPERKDAMGEKWDAELTCKECGKKILVKPNRLKQPYAICYGTEAKPHEGSFLKRDGSLGNPTSPKKG